MKSSEATTFEEVGAGLLSAGWVEIFTLKNGSVCGLQWTPKGEQRGLLLRPIIESFGLAGNAERAKQFTDDCENETASPTADAREVGKLFWLTCLDELAISRDQTPLWVFVRIIKLGDELSTLSLTSPELANRSLVDIVAQHG